MDNVVTLINMPVATCATPVKTPSDSVSDSDEDFEDARDAISSARADAADEGESNGTGEEGDLSEDDVIVDFLGKSTGEVSAGNEIPINLMLSIGE